MEERVQGTLFGARQRINAGESTPAETPYSTRGKTASKAMQRDEVQTPHLREINLLDGTIYMPANDALED